MQIQINIPGLMTGHYRGRNLNEPSSPLDSADMCSAAATKFLGQYTTINSQTFSMQAQ